MVHVYDCFMQYTWARGAGMVELVARAAVRTGVPERAGFEWPLCAHGAEARLLQVGDDQHALPAWMHDLVRAAGCFHCEHIAETLQETPRALLQVACGRCASRVAMSVRHAHSIDVHIIVDD